MRPKKYPHKVYRFVKILFFILNVKEYNNCMYYFVNYTNIKCNE